MTETLINCPDPSQADLVLLAAPYDGTSSFGKGADKGPGAILKCFNEQLELYERWTNTIPSKVFKIAADTSLHLVGLPPEQMITAVYNRAKLYREQEKFVITLGGEHSVSLGAVSAACENNDNVTVLQIDAHADLRDSDADYNDTSPSRYAHSCVMRRIISDMGYKTVQAGVRIYSEEEHTFIKENRLKVFEWSARIPQVKEILAAIETPAVYLTLDIDGIDPAHMPATGTPVQGGLEWYYTIELIRELFRNFKVVGADIVETAPRPHDSLTEFGAAQLAYLMAGCRVRFNILR